MSGAGNTTSGATIFTDNTTSGGPNDVTVANLRVEQDMRVDGNFEVGTFSIDDLTVNDDLNVTDQLTIGGNTYAQYLETALDLNCHGDVLVDQTIVAAGTANLNGGIAVATDKFTVAPITGNTIIKGTLQVDGGISGIAAGTVTGAMQYRGSGGDFDADDSFVYTPATKRLRVGTGTANTADIEPTGVTVTDISGDGQLFHNRIHISDPTDTHVARVRLNGTTMEVGPSTATTLALQTSGTTRATVNSTTGQVAITNGIASSSTTTGALVVTGGVGASGNINAGGAMAVGGAISAGGNVTVPNGSDFSGGGSLSGVNVGTGRFTSSTNSSTTSNGAVVVTGGTGIGGNVNGGGYIRAASGLATQTAQSPFVIDYGTTASASSGTVTFTRTFSAAPTVTIGMLRNGTGAVAVKTISSTQFTWECWNFAAANVACQLMWMAIGVP